MSMDAEKPNVLIMGELKVLPGGTELTTDDNVPMFYTLIRWVEHHGSPSGRVISAFAWRTSRWGKSNCLLAYR
jgi:hypothetical protein